MLENAKILIAREPDKAGTLKAKLDERGAIVTCVGLIKIYALTDQQVSRVMEEIAWYDFVVITSANAAKHFLSHVPPVGDNPRVVAIGDASAQAVEAAGWKPDLVGEGRGAAFLARQMHEKYNLKGQRILYPSSSLAGEDFEKIALSLGAKEVNSISVYENTVPENIDTARLEGQDLALFYSPSAVTNYVKLLRLNKVPDKLGTIAVGPTTSSALTKAGAVTNFESASPDTEDMLRATINCWRRINNMEDQ